MNSPIVHNPLTQPSTASNGDTRPVIELEHVTVRYRVPKEQVRTFKEYAIRRVQGKVGHQEFLALNDVSLTVNRGEVFGLVGEIGRASCRERV